MNSSKWDARIRRASELASSYPFAAEGLCFYARVATFQKNLYADIQQALADSPKMSPEVSLRDQLDLFLLLSNFSGFLSLIQQIAPAPLAQAAAGLAQKGPPGWHQAIEDFWKGELETPMAGGEEEEKRTSEPGETTPQERLLAWIFLQPYAEYLANQREPISVDELPGPARYAEASRSWASCGATATERRSR